MNSYIRDRWEFWNLYPGRNRMTAREAESALEVINDYDLPRELVARAVAALQERAGLAPFNAYRAAHAICASLLYPLPEGVES